LSTSSVSTHPMTPVTSSGLHRNGEVLDGITDENGESPLLNSTELDTWSLEIVHDTDTPEGTA